MGEMIYPLPISNNTVVILKVHQGKINNMLIVTENISQRPKDENYVYERAFIANQ